MQRIPRIHLLLFFATIYTTLVAGAAMQGYQGLWLGANGIRAGLNFSIPLLIILGCHETGHYLMSRKHRVAATLPYFIPAPPFLTFIGTFGAVIRIKEPIRRRRALMEIAIAGPIASYVLSILAIIIGYATLPEAAEINARIEHIHHLMGIDSHPEAALQLSMGSSLLFRFLSSFFPATVPMNEIYHFPLIFAGWIGLLVTALNLIPVSQLDGGHIAFAVWGRHHDLVGKYIIGGLFLLGLVSSSWLIWAFLLLLLSRARHPPVFDAFLPFSRTEKWIAAAALFMLVTSFIPVPFSI